MKKNKNNPTASYRVRLSKDHIRALKDTVEYYQEAVSYLVPIAEMEYDSYAALTSNYAMTYLEKAVHSTKNRKAKYPNFDKKFYKMPAVFRRSALHDAIGIVSSYKSNYDNWLQNEKQGKKPKLRIQHSKMPCFYKKDMFRMLEDGLCEIKLRYQNDWKFFAFRLKKTDLYYITKRYDFTAASAPTLEKAGRGYALRFAFQEKISLPKEVHRICSVDLGMNSDAVLSVMDAEGTATARKFLTFSGEKDHLYAILDRISYQQSLGNKKNKKLWAFAKHLNEEICRKTVIQIIQFALQHKCQCIVMEHLDFQKGMTGNQKKKFRHWRYRSIAEKMKYKAHLHSLRFSTVNAWNTSKLAYDGSGKVRRGKEIKNKRIPKVYSLCEFSSGKIYNCDLNASYNIGARYFIRLKMNSLPADEKETIEAKVPQTKKRTSQTLDTLLRLNTVLQ